MNLGTQEIKKVDHKNIGKHFILLNKKTPPQTRLDVERLKFEVKFSKEDNNLVKQNILMFEDMTWSKNKKDEEILNPAKNKEVKAFSGQVLGHVHSERGDLEYKDGQRD